MRIRFLHTEGFRLSAIYAGIFVLSALVLGGAVLFITGSALEEQILQFSSADIAAVRNGFNSEGLSEAREIIGQRMAAPGSSDYFLLQQRGRRIAGNMPAMPERTGTLRLPPFSGDPDHAVLGAGALLAPGLYVFVGSDLYRVEAVRARILTLMTWLFVAAFILALAGGALASRKFLRRADAIARTCRAIIDGDLKTRIPVRGTQDELDRLAGTINAMIDRIVALMENVRQVTNDVAHDLRTPVTHLRHRLEKASTETATDEDRRQALTDAIASTDDILALFAALLRIAQIEAGARRAGFAQVDIGRLLGELRDVFVPVAEDAAHRLEIEVLSGAMVLGDRELLIQLFSNLIENAIVHTPSGTRINVKVTAGAAHIVVTICDDGPGVLPEERAKLFQRFYRREASRTRPGYGLGLSLVHAISELHGADIGLEDGVLTGLCVRIVFPANSAA